MRQASAGRIYVRQASVGLERNPAEGVSTGLVDTSNVCHEFWSVLWEADRVETSERSPTMDGRSCVVVSREILVDLLVELKDNGIKWDDLVSRSIFNTNDCVLTDSQAGTVVAWGATAVNEIGDRHGDRFGSIERVHRRT
ncbi:hypothetical protein WN55_09230 [Dufourea novaeangliae]|uniref:Uncharacterized protein n=1 Tax=Dufourea novaeangliae TaxID=178035 RepID=A0A154P8S4_DUFNO|nr:hypothetical protein WN55_09230 [Dufourea novaeangliae]